MPRSLFPPLRFRVHDIVIERAEHGRPAWRRSVDEELGRQLAGFPLADESTAADIVLRDVADLAFDHVDAVVIENYVFGDGVLLDLKERIGIRLAHERLTYWCPSASHLSVPYLIQLLLPSRNRSFVHCAALAVRGAGVLLPSFGGIGKTSLVAEALREDGVKLLGDDLCMVAADGTLLGYPRPFALYRYHMPLFEDYYRRNRFRYLRPPLFWRIVFRAAREARARLNVPLPRAPHVTHVGGYVTANPVDLFGSDSIEMGGVPLTKVICMTRSPAVTAPIRAPLTVERASAFAIGVTLHEWAEFHRRELAYSIHRAVPPSGPDFACERIVGAAFQRVREVHSVTLPETLSPAQVFDAIRDVIGL